MKRRNFIKNLGLSAPSVLATSSLITSPHSFTPAYSYGKIEHLDEAVSKKGEIMVRLEFRSSEIPDISSTKDKIKIKNGKLSKSKSYFFENGEDKFASEDISLQVQSSGENVDILVLWLNEFSPKTEISFKHAKGKYTFTLQQLVDHEEFAQIFGKTKITSNLLLDKEIGELDLKEIGAKIPGDTFRFVIMADPQGGDPKEKGNHPTRMKIHNAWIEESIVQANKLDPEPVFSIMLGDIVDGQGQEANFQSMEAFFKELKSPILYAVGNHETRYKAEFTPGYYMEEFNNFFAAQKKINGLELMLYSFNLGKWHFIVWPDPLRNNFWETHPHYFDWLEEDLEKHKDRPTIFMQHVPSHPIGINPLINYAESVEVKRTLLALLTRHSNVKYNFSGHVHIPIKASFKTAVEYKGMKMINLPAAGYRPRAFGEEDFGGGPCQGILVVDINDDQAKATFKTVTQEVYEYPETLPKFEEEKYKLWLNYKFELPASDKLVNGDFKNGIEGWTKRFVYTEDKNPSNICEIRDNHGQPCLYLFSRKRGYDIPGQDRLPQTINRISQTVKLKPGESPSISLNYQIDKAFSDQVDWCGAYIWIEGFDRSFKKLNLIYWTGIAYGGLGGRFNQSEFCKNVHLKMADQNTETQQTHLNILKDFEKNSTSKFHNLNLDKLTITLGTWTINDGQDFPYGIYFRDIQLNYGNSEPSKSGNTLIMPKPDNEIWWMGKYFPFTHIAGEHQYILNSKKMGNS
ncbi:metallophosphoesterase family protein [Flexithrix dorotheae]|uniref:metallophosphoesterase family protein n=1 Tax=Flexithrix dorotheae TaxID=70993 RepID=UPI0003651673|nr:metallophosphoesterase [Flexithrix dorotheae]